MSWRRAHHGGHAWFGGKCPDSLLSDGQHALSCQQLCSLIAMASQYCCSCAAANISCCPFESEILCRRVFEVVMLDLQTQWRNQPHQKVACESRLQETAQITRTWSAVGMRCPTSASSAYISSISLASPSTASASSCTAHRLPLKAMHGGITTACMHVPAPAGHPMLPGPPSVRPSAPPAPQRRPSWRSQAAAP